MPRGWPCWSGWRARPHIARLRGAVGLIPATREPAMLAVSILAQVAAAHDAAARALQEDAAETGDLVRARSCACAQANQVQ
jgi:xanthine/CO dehydrogenase XdhC/CoxF family maturation factor